MNLYKRVSFILISVLLLNPSSILTIPTYGSELNLDNISQQVTFKINSQWNGSFIGEILITNTSDSPLSNWELQFTLSHNITSMWNSKFSKAGDLYTLEYEDYNSTLYPNQTISIGFIAKYDTDIILPENYILKANGKVLESSVQTSPVPINNITTPCSLQVDIPCELKFNTSEDEIWFSFTPSTSASYEFISEGNANLCTSLYDETKQNIISANKDTSNSQSLGATLLADKKYYIKATPLNFNPDNPYFNITVKYIAPPNDPLFPEQWALLNTSTGIDINILPVWSHLNKNNTPISISDTGTYYKHEDLYNNMNLDLSYNFTHFMTDTFPENELYRDAYTAVFGHGTHVAGIIAAETNNCKGISGIVPSANLISLKTLGRRIRGIDVYNKSIAAFEYAVEYAQQNGIKIINCSFGGVTASTTELNAMRNAKDILFVIAAGNSGYDLAQNPYYPACYDLPNAIVVADITSDGTLSSTSNYGGPTAIAAPGTDIISTLPYDDYNYMSGTSMAAPFVTSICGLVWAQNENLTPEEVKAYVTNPANVTPLDSLQSTTLSGGLLNAYKAIVCPNLNNEIRSVQSINDPFSGNIKETISYYKSIAPINTKTDEVIVKFNDSVIIDEWVEKLNRLHDFNNISKVDYLAGPDAYVIRFSSIAEADLAVDLLNDFNEVSYAEPNYIRE